MGQLIDPLEGEVEILKDRTPAPSAQSQEVVVALRLPAILADRVVQFGAATIIAVGVLIMLFMVDHSGPSAEDTIEAQKAHIASMERNADRMLELAQTAVAAAPVGAMPYDAPMLILLSVCLGIVIAMALFFAAVLGQ